jgi:hypothetical protein
MENLEDRMTKWDSEFEDRMTKMDSEFEDRMTKWDTELKDRNMKWDSEFKDRMTKMENSIKEDWREMLSEVVRNLECKMNERTESVNNGGNVISEPTHGHIQIPIDTVRDDKSENFVTQIKHQSSSCDSEVNVEEPATLATQAHATIDQKIVVSQEERMLSSENSTDQPEIKLSDTDERNCAGSGLHGRDVMSSISRSQVICGNLAEAPQTGIEPGDVTQQCGDQSCVAQLQLQFGAEKVEPRQTTEYRGSATPLYLSERQSRTGVRNWKKRKKTLKDKGTTGTVKSKVSSMSRCGDFTSPIHLHAWTVGRPWTWQMQLEGYQCNRLR